MTTERFAPRTAAEAAARARGCTAEHLLLLIPPDLHPLEDALLRASLGPLAVERAPARLNAVAAAENADPADAEAAARFLEEACSTTGQLLEVGSPA